MTMNRNMTRAKRGASPRTNWSLVGLMPGRSLFVYCSGSIPANLSFDGGVRFGHQATESQGIADSRQLQL